MKRRVATTLALALLVVGCGSAAKGEQVPLPTREASSPCCILLYTVMDVIADPVSGTPTGKTGRPLTWPAGYTAWRVGTETEVRDAAGHVVLTTGGRYYIRPTGDYPYDVVGEVSPCPDCELGGGPL